MSSRAFLVALVVAALLVVAVLYLRRGEEIPAEPAHAPMTAEARLERGRYLVENVVHCFACHADVDWAGTGLAKAGTEGGGQVYDDNFPFPIYAPNISPDPETGAGTWTD